MPRPYVRIHGQRFGIQQASDGLMELVAFTPDVVLADDEATLLISAVRAATNTTDDQTNTTSAKGLILFLDVTAVTALQTLTVNLQAKDPTSGKYLTIATTGAIGTTATPTGTFALVLYPALGSVSSPLFGQPIALPYTWRAQIVHSGGGSFTYSLGRSLLR